MMPLLRAQNLSKVYQLDGIVVKALEKINLEIKQGEMSAIMGPSGCGKSTLMHLLGCLDTPTSGKIFLDGKDISSLSEKELAKIRSQKIGFVFQSYNLIPRTSALDNVSLPLIYAGVNASERKKMALNALKLVDLEQRSQHLPNQLSGGEQQRVAIARALINEPQVIFADEPTGNLDSKSGAEIMKIFTALNKEGHTIVLVTHSLSIAKLTRRIIRLKDGRIISDIGK